MRVERGADIDDRQVRNRRRQRCRARNIRARWIACSVLDDRAGIHRRSGAREDRRAIRSSARSVGHSTTKAVVGSAPRQLGPRIPTAPPGPSCDEVSAWEAPAGRPARPGPRPASALGTVSITGSPRSSHEYHQCEPRPAEDGRGAAGSVRLSRSQRGIVDRRLVLGRQPVQRERTRCR